MEKSETEMMASNKCINRREFDCGLVEVAGNRMTLKLNREFLGIPELAGTGSITLDSEDEAASVDKMRAAADYFAELAQDIRQAVQLYDSRKPEMPKTGAAETVSRNQQQQAEHLKKIHMLIEELPEEEKAIYQGFGFSERARMYKLVDDETDPAKLQELMCATIRALSEEKRS